MEVDSTQSSNSGALQDVRVSACEYEQLRLLASVLNGCADAIVSATTAGAVMSWNSGAERLYGYTPTEVTGQPLTLILRGEGELFDLTRRALGPRAAERSVRYEAIRRCKSGRQIAVSVTASPLRDDSQRIFGMCEVSREISARERADRNGQIDDRLRNLAGLASRIAHEINNPLTSVGNLLFLLEQEQLSMNGTRYVAMAHREVGRIARMSAQVLTLYKSSGKPILTCVADILNDALAMHADRCRDTHIHISREFQPVHMISCQPDELRQAFSSLIGHAVDAMPATGSLRLRIRESRDWETGRRGLRITIANTSRGRCADTPKRLEPFFTSHEEADSALGLRSCVHIIAKLGGRVLLRSSNAREDGGSVFAVFLPL